MKPTKLFKRVLMVAAMMALPPQWATAYSEDQYYDFKVGELCYDYNSDGTSVTVTCETRPFELDMGYHFYRAYNSLLSADLIIPETVTYDGTTYSVTAIGWMAFNECSELTSVTIPKSIRHIGDNAFSRCWGLTSVIWNAQSCADITKGKDNPFLSFFIEDYYAEWDYYPNTTITSFTFGDEVERIPAYLCYGLEGLSSVTIPNSVTAIGKSAFDSCSGLKSIVVNSGNTNYDSRNHCNALIETASNTLIAGCKNTTIPTSVTAIGDNAFYGCSGLNSVTIPNSVTSLGNRAFSGCNGLTSVIWNAQSCADFAQGAENPFFSFFINEYGEEDWHWRDSVYSPNTSITSFSFGDEVQRIPAHLCYSIAGLKSVTIPNSVTSIGNGAFSGCNGLTSVVWNAKSCADFTEENNPFLYYVDEGWEESGDWYDSGYYPNTAIKSITFGDEVQRIPAYLCYRMTGLTSLTLPNAVTTIGNGAFDGCSGLTGVLTIPNTVTAIGDYAFSGCSGLTGSLTLPHFVTAIGNGVFTSCSGLTGALTIPNTVTTIGISAFSDCSGLTSVSIGNSVTAIGDNAFNGCNGLTGALTLPNSVTTIGNGAFNGCNGLSGALTIPNSVTSIGEMAFYGYTLTSLTICGGIESIGSNVFSNRNINILTLKSEVTNIKNLGTNPSSIYSYATTPPECDANTFKSYDATLHMPAGAMAAYFQAPYWLNFANIVGDAVEPTSLTMSADTTYVELGSQLTLQCTLLPSNATNVGMEWTTSDASIATVNNNGTVSALQPGECDITVTCADLVAHCHLVVLEQMVTITLDHHALEMEPNTIQWLTPSFAPVSTDITASSSNTDVALVKVINGRMQVLAVQPGHAVVTVRSVDGNAVPDSCVVTVLNPALHGDINNDGLVDIADVNLVINVMLGFDIPTGNQGGNLGPDDSEQTLMGDLNGDGCVDIFDVNLAINAMLGKNPRPTPPNIFTVNGVSFNMIEVEGGTFTMGGTSEQGSDAKSNEMPTHQVTLSSFSIGQTEVTQELWQAVMGSNPSEFTGDLQRPVENVSWNDCQTFITKLNQLTGMNFRLPTEAEWEYAARGGNRSQGYKYAGSRTVGPVAWYSANAYDVGSDSPDYGTHTVATKAPNELALYDMSGNVWEWCQDWYGDYSSDAQVNPTGPDTGTAHVYRGGSWNSLARRCRVSRRDYNPPTFLLNHLGLRLAL